MKRPKIYAYVSAECCTMTLAFQPGAEYQGVPVSKHGDLHPWAYGKRATLARCENGLTPYSRRSARAVADKLGWL